MYIYILITIQIILIMSLNYLFNKRVSKIGVDIHEKIHLYVAKVLGMRANQNKITAKDSLERNILGEVTIENPNYLAFFSGVAPLMLPVLLFSIPFYS